MNVGYLLNEKMHNDKNQTKTKQNPTTNLYQSQHLDVFEEKEYTYARAVLFIQSPDNSYWAIEL